MGTTKLARFAMFGTIITCFAAGFLATTGIIMSSPPGEESESVVPSRGGSELVLVLVGSSRCGASRSPAFEAAVATIRRQLRQQAHDSGRRLVSIGVSLDEDPEVGFDFLRRFGPFNEILTGGGWMNTGSLAYIIRDLPGRRAVPQIVVLDRDVTLFPGSAPRVAVQLAARKVGLDEVTAFAASIAEAVAPQLIFH